MVILYVFQGHSHIHCAEDLTSPLQPYESRQIEMRHLLKYQFQVKDLDTTAIHFWFYLRVPVSHERRIISLVLRKLGGMSARLSEPI